MSKELKQEGIYEVQVAGVTLECTDFYTQAKEAFDKSRSNAVMTKRTGSMKKVIDWKRVRTGTVKEQLVSKGVMQ